MNVSNGPSSGESDADESFFLERIQGCGSENSRGDQVLAVLCFCDTARDVTRQAAHSWSKQTPMPIAYSLNQHPLPSCLFVGRSSGPQLTDRSQALAVLVVVAQRARDDPPWFVPWGLPRMVEPTVFPGTGATECMEVCERPFGARSGPGRPAKKGAPCPNRPFPLVSGQ